MLGVYGQIQRKGEVIHIIAKKLYDLSDMLASLGDQNQPFRIQHGRGDGVQNGGAPDRRGGKAPGLAGRDIYIPDLHIDTMKLKARDLR